MWANTLVSWLRGLERKTLGHLWRAQFGTGLPRNNLHKALSACKLPNGALLLAITFLLKFMHIMSLCLTRCAVGGAVSQPWAEAVGRGDSGGPVMLLFGA